jgi:hypothetical protein
MAASESPAESRADVPARAPDRAPVREPARAVVVGGTGTIGAKLVRRLRAAGHEARAASPSIGVDTVTGAGLAEVLQGADLVVDASKPRSSAPEALTDLFTDGIEHLLAAEREAGVRHHLTLSIVGADRAPDVPFYRAKAGMERIVRAGGIPWTILRATQFFEFARGIVGAAERDGETVLLPPIRVRPIAGDAVAEHLAALVGEILTSDPGRAGAGGADGDPEIAGPREMPLIEFVASALGSDAPPLEESADAPYFGGAISADTLLPGAGARIVGPDLEGWLQRRDAAPRA